MPYASVAFLLLSFLALPLQARTDPIQKALTRFDKSKSEGCESAPPVYKVLDRWPNRAPRTIVVLFRASSRCASELAVFGRDRSGTLHHLASNEDDEEFVDLDVRDLTGDGIPEILAGLQAKHTVAGEVYQWDGHALHDIAVSAGELYVDLDHDGTEEIVKSECCETNECGSVIGQARVQRFRNGEFSGDGNQNIVEVFVLSKYQTGPETPERGVNISRTLSRHCHIRVVNGVRGGKQRVSGLKLAAFGRTEGGADGPKQRIPITLTAADEFADATVDLPSRCNLLDITLKGPKGATVAIVVESLPTQ